jgi:hypothetical protein
VNIDRAKQIRSTLSANGAASVNPLRLRVDAVGDLMKLLGERVAVNARQANISIQLVPHSTSSSAAATPAPAPLHLFAWHYDSLSPRTELLNILRYLSPESATDAYPEINGTEKLYAEERRVLDERQVLPLLLIPDYVGIAPAVRNWSVAPSGEWRLADVWLDSGESVGSTAATPPSRNPAPGVHP